MRTDPRIRQNLNQLSSTIESATDTVGASCFAFTKTYVEPLYHSVANCCTSCTSYNNDPAHHHGDARRRNAEFPFDFYNDEYWYDDYADGGNNSRGGFVAWGNDELDRLLAGNGPSRSETMYYGIGGGGPSSGSGGGDVRSGPLGLIGGRRKRSAVTPHDGGPDPTVIPNTTMFGFLSRFPFFRGSTLRYRPSAADLQEHPGMHREFPQYDEEAESLLHDSQPRSIGNGEGDTRRGRRRSTAHSSSGESGASYRSRGDLFPSDGEDDAVPLGDEFSIALRGSGGGSDIHRGSMYSSSPGTFGGRQSHRTSISGHHNDDHFDADNQEVEMPSSPYVGPMDEDELRRQEDAITAAEEHAIEQKREAAKRLALARGLSHDGTADAPPSPIQKAATSSTPILGPKSVPVNANNPRSQSSPPHSPRSFRRVMQPMSTPTSPRSRPTIMRSPTMRAAAEIVRSMSPMSLMSTSPKKRPESIMMREERREEMPIPPLDLNVRLERAEIKVEPVAERQGAAPEPTREAVIAIQEEKSELKEKEKESEMPSSILPHMRPASSHVYEVKEEEEVHEIPNIDVKEIPSSILPHMRPSSSSPAVTTEKHETENIHIAENIRTEV